VKARVLMNNPADFSLLETMLWEPDNKYFLLDYHLRRLSDSAEYFGIPLKTEQVRRKLETLGRSLSSCSHKVRLLVSQDGDISFECTPLNDTNGSCPVRLRLASKKIDSSNPFLYHKTTNRDIYISAGISSPDCDDTLLWNEKSEITETTIANIIVKLDGELVTPPVSCGLLPGTYRAWLIDRKMVREQVITVDDLEKCSVIYTVNSVRKMREAVMV